MAKKASTSSSATVFFNSGAPSPGVAIAKYTTRAPDLSRSRRFGLSRLVIVVSIGLRVGRTLHSAQNARMRATSTEVLGQRLSDLHVRRSRVFSQQSG